MVQLPTFADLGQRDPQASMQKLEYPDNPMHEALKQIGKEVTAAGGVLAERRQQMDVERKQARSFELEGRLLDLESQEQTWLPTAMDKAKPGAAGFTKDYVKRFDD